MSWWVSCRSSSSCVQPCRRPKLFWRSSWLMHGRAAPHFGTLRGTISFCGKQSWMWKRWVGFSTPLHFSRNHLSSVALLTDLWATCAQERDTERQRVEELLDVNVSLETDLRHCGAVATAVHPGFLHSEPDFEAELMELIGQCAGLRISTFHFRHFN